MFTLLLPVLFLLSSSSSAAPLGNEVIYQIITDRFADGNPKNNGGDSDSDKKDWNKYWGGDWEGIEARLGYLRSLGVTQIWISPIIQNAKGFAVGDGTLKTSYHGFWGKDWFRLNEHWTRSGTQDWESLDRLIRKAREAGIGLIVDTVVNHTSPAYDAEYGALYENGKFIADTKNDPKQIFHPYPGILWDLAEANPKDNPRIDLLRDYLRQHDLLPKDEHLSIEDLQALMLQKFKLADLADLDENKPLVRDYMRRAHLALAERGISGFRLDSARHMPLAHWSQWFKDIREKRPDLFVIGEWFNGGPQNAASMEFVKQTGMTIFDFQLRGRIRDLMLGKTDLTALAQFLASSLDPETGIDRARDLVTFIDNHDLPRLMSEGVTREGILESLKLLFAVRGIPSVYYGTEVFLHTKTEGGRDPYNRDWMRFPSPSSEAFGIKLLSELTEFRKKYPALRFGRTTFLTKKPDLLVFRRGEAGHGDVIMSIQSQKKGVRPYSPPQGYREHIFGSGHAPAAQKSGWKIRAFIAL